MKEVENENNINEEEEKKKENQILFDQNNTDEAEDEKEKENSYIIDNDSVDNDLNRSSMRSNAGGQDGAEIEADNSPLNKSVVYKPQKSVVYKPQKSEASILDDNYRKAMNLFNTKRASIFKQESEEHQAVREAAEKLMKFKKDTGKNGYDNPADVISGDLSHDAKVEYAARWLEHAIALKQEAQSYYNTKSGLTFAGSDRRKGAQALKKLANMEMKNCINALEKNGISVAEVYKELAATKAHKAEEQLEKYNGKLSAEMTDKDRQNIYEAVTDYLGAITSNHLIRQEEKRKGLLGKEVTAQDVKGLDFGKVRWRMQHTVYVNAAVWNYVINEPTNKIRSDMKTEAGFIKSLKKYDNDLMNNIEYIGTSTKENNKKKEQKKQEEQRKAEEKALKQKQKMAKGK